MSDHNQVITPRTDPGRFTEKEAALYAAGKCGWQAGYGLPWTTYCEAPSKPGASFGHCAEHETEMLADYWPDGTPRQP